MLETFSGACVKENTSLTLQSAGHDFTARGSIMVETGWRAVLNEPVEEKEEDMTLLPDIVQGDELPVKGCGTEQKQTRPRPLHTESSLLAAMESFPSQARERMLSLKTLLVGLLRAQLPQTVVLGPADERAAGHILSVAFPPVRAETLLHALEADGIYVGTGSACSSKKGGHSHVLTAMGCTPEVMDGAIRISLCPENTEEEMRLTAQSIARHVALLARFTRR